MIAYVYYFCELLVIYIFCIIAYLSAFGFNIFNLSVSLWLQSLAEKGGPALEKVEAHSNFFVLATMNPGGDYGKKELSPALRNRFTEIWVPPVNDLDELQEIALKRYL